MPTKTLSTFCCVIDKHPRFYVELVLWALCAKRHLASDRFRMIVYFVGIGPRDLVNWLHAQNIETRQATAVLEGSPHCNKIAPFFDSQVADHMIVCDADLFVVDDLSCFLTSTRFRAPPNNHCNPPPHIFKEILSASGLGRQYRPGIALCKSPLNGMRETHINNISAGIIVAPAQRSEDFARLWKKWALWLIENRSLLGNWAIHVDQVAFALVMEELGEDVEFLPPQTNTILHILDEIASVWAFHLTTGHIPSFPERFNVNRTLNSEGLDEGIEDAVNRLNNCILEAIEVIQQLPSTREHTDKFLNPKWIR